MPAAVTRRCGCSRSCAIQTYGRIATSTRALSSSACRFRSIVSRRPRSIEEWQRATMRTTRASSRRRLLLRRRPSRMRGPLASAGAFCATCSPTARRPHPERSFTLRARWRRPATPRTRIACSRSCAVMASRPNLMPTRSCCARRWTTSATPSSTCGISRRRWSRRRRTSRMSSTAAMRSSSAATTVYVCWMRCYWRASRRRSI